MTTMMMGTWRRWRHLVVAMVTCAVVLSTYILWTSTFSHVVKHHGPKTPVDWSSTRRRVDHGVRDLPKPRLTDDIDLKAVGDKLVNKNSEVYASNKTLPSRATDTLVADDSDRIAFRRHSQRVRPVVQKHEEHSVINRSEHSDQIPATAVDNNKLLKNKNKWRENAQGAESVSGKESNTRAWQPHSVVATATPLYLVVSHDDSDKENVEVFREPEVVIRSSDADRPRSRRVSRNTTGINGEYGLGGGKRSPLLGALRGGPGNCRLYNVRDDVPELVDFAAGVECVDLTTTPTVVVCPYPDSDDQHLSRPLRTHGVWEPNIVKLFQAALLTDSQLGVYDVGANVGQYALLAAAMGRRVVAVELHRPNIYRLHKAIKLGRFEDKIVVVENGVSDERETFELSVNDGDPSGVRLTSKNADKFCDEPECRPHANTILLDDLLEVTNFKAAVMKVDVEGYEHRAFSHADELLGDVRVPYIFMEWVRMRQLYGADVEDTPDKRLVQRMIDSLSGRRYSPCGITHASLRTLDLRTWYAWPDDIVWVLAGSTEPKKLAELAPELPSSKRSR